ncbi:MAG: hypothetical protein M0R74_15550, partial [Dehalococcoidia bacterium]|nr:hypothetical protein [Dehalococcoidia bacterium]
MATIEAVPASASAPLDAPVDGAGRRVLVLSRAKVGPRMASPGIRAYQIAGALGRLMPDAEITLAAPSDYGDVAPPAPNVRIQQWHSNGDAVRIARAHDVTVS